MFARHPGVTAVAIVTLAIGIGGTTAIFAFVDAVLVRPLPYPDSERLVVVTGGSPDGSSSAFSAVTPGDFLDWQAQAQSFEAMAAFSGATFSLSGRGEPERLRGAIVTRDFLRTLGAAPLLGTPFEARADAATGPFIWGHALGGEVVIGERLWRQRFGADAAIVGKAITLDGRPFTIAGVMPQAFTFPLDMFRFPGGRAWQPPDVWALAALEPGYRNNALLQVAARLKDGATPDAAQSEMRAIASRIGRALAADRRVEPIVLPLHERIVGDVRPLLTVLLGAVGFVLLIACVNIANLLLARAAARRREVAVRAALGSGTWRLVRQLLTESVLLGLAGGAAGVLIAMWGVDLARALVPSGALPRLQETGFDTHALLFTVTIAIGSGLLFGLAPAVHSSGAPLVAGLKEGASGDGPRLRFLNVLVVAEVALAFVLLAGAGVMVRSFVRLTSVDPGFQPDGTLTLSVTLPESAYATTEQMRRFTRDVLDRLARRPGIERAGAVNWLPLGGPMLSGSIIVEGLPESAPGQWASKPAVTPDYFRAMGIPLRSGRPFDERDTADSARVAIVTERLARRLWPDRDPIGRRLHTGFARTADQPWITVVGVVADVRGTRLQQDPDPAVYVPIEQAPVPFLLQSLTFVARTAGDPLAAAGAARRAIRDTDPSLPIDRVDTMENLVAGSVAEPRFRSMLFTAFGVAALGLVATGILGVLAYAVTRRTREIGVRIALGAQGRDVLRLVMRQTLGMAAAGVVLGLAASAALMRLLARFLYEVQPFDPPSLAGASLTLFAVAIAAVYVPARRALRVDPLAALRAE